MRTQCNSKPLEFEDQGRRRLVAKKLIFLRAFCNIPQEAGIFMVRGAAQVHQRVQPLMAPLRIRNRAQGNSERHRSMVVESRA